jgi:glycosyltransferase involved in cell wall biosynthesis
MTNKAIPSITVAIAAYQAERFIGETLESILSQTHPPDEVLVVDDGSTDGTARELDRFGERIRVLRRPNGGCAAAFNTAFQEARCDYVAECGADDIWEPHKLERQIHALVEHPEIDIIFSAARVFGNREGRWGIPSPEETGAGILDRHAFGRIIFKENPVCPSTTLTRRSLYEQLGPFIERDHIATEDYEYWIRALCAGAVFYYDPEMLVRYRRHESNASSDHLAMREADLLVHRWYADKIGDRSLARAGLARSYFIVGRLLRNQNRVREARTAFAASIRHKPSLRALAWLLVLSVPERHRHTLANRVIAIKRSVPEILR